MSQDPPQDSAMATGLLQRLVDSMQEVQYQNLQLEPEDLPPINPSWVQNWTWFFAAAGLMFFALALRKWWLRRRWQRKWPAMAQFAQNGGSAEEALVEFQRLELLSTMIEGNPVDSIGEWFALTDSEQAIALGTLMDKSTKEMAEKLACTPSYIYNVRASIRKKWNLDSQVNLRSAIAERYAQTGKPFPSEES